MAPTLGDNLAHLLRVIAFLCVMTFILSTSAFAQNVCTVTDPNGDPVKCKSNTCWSTSPRSLLQWRSMSSMYQTGRDLRGKTWALVGKPGGSAYGWVFRDYINCDGENVSPPPNTSAPTTAQSPVQGITGEPNPDKMG